MEKREQKEKRKEKRKEKEKTETDQNKIAFYCEKMLNERDQKLDKNTGSPFSLEKEPDCAKRKRNREREIVKVKRYKHV